MQPTPKEWQAANSRCDTVSRVNTMSRRMHRIAHPAVFSQSSRKSYRIRMERMMAYLVDHKYHSIIEKEWSVAAITSATMASCSAQAILQWIRPSSSQMPSWATREPSTWSSTRALTPSRRQRSGAISTSTGRQLSPLTTSIDYFRNSTRINSSSVATPAMCCWVTTAARTLLEACGLPQRPTRSQDTLERYL